jgi:hypothetical protein
MIIFIICGCSISRFKTNNDYNNNNNIQSGIQRLAVVNEVVKILIPQITQISWPTDRLLVSQEGLCSVQLVG